MRECWIAGARYQLTGDSQTRKGTPWSGNWETNLSVADKSVRLGIKLESVDGKVTGFIESIPEPLRKEGDSDAKPSGKKKNRRKAKNQIELKSVKVERDRLSATCDLSSLGFGSESGVWLVTIVQSDPSDATSSSANLNRIALLYLQTPTGDEQVARLLPSTG